MSNKRPMAASQIVSDYGKDLEEFIQQVDVLVSRLSETEATMPVGERRREVCAVIWAAITAAFQASALSPEENEKLAPMLLDVLIPFWQKHCAKDARMAEVLAERAEFYLRGRDPKSQVATASMLVRRLLETIGASPESTNLLSRSLVPMFAHRILGDTIHINDVKTKFGIQWSVLAAIFTAVGLAQLWAPALRLLRLG